MDLDRLVRALFARPVYQRFFLAFTLGLFISCSVRVAGASPVVTEITSTVSAASH